MIQRKFLLNRDKVFGECPDTLASLVKSKSPRRSHQQKVSNPENTALKEKQRNQHFLPDERK